jgi:hypothetical protein
MTAAAVVLFGRRHGAGRGAGGFVIAVYVAFVVVQIVART